MYHKEKAKIYQRHSALNIQYSKLYEDYEWKRKSSDNLIEKKVQKLIFQANLGKPGADVLINCFLLFT